MINQLAAVALVLISLTAQTPRMRYGFLPSLDLIKVAASVAKKIN